MCRRVLKCQLPLLPRREPAILRRRDICTSDTFHLHEGHRLRRYSFKTYFFRPTFGAFFFSLDVMSLVAVGIFWHGRVWEVKNTRTRWGGEDAENMSRIQFPLMQFFCMSAKAATLLLISLWTVPHMHGLHLADCVSFV